MTSLSKSKAPMARHRSPLQEAPSKGNIMPFATDHAQRLKPMADVKLGKKPISSHHPALEPRVRSARSSVVSKYASNRASLTAKAPPKPRKTHIGPWQLGETIGKGGSCSVRLVRHHKTGQIAVAKIVAKVMADKVRARSLANLVSRIEMGTTMVAAHFKMPVALEREVVIMRLLDHPNIVRLYDVWESQEEIYLIMERVAGGELFDYISDHGPLPEYYTVYLFRQLVQAMIYCHRMQIFHRDLKPENILLDKEKGEIKLIDFGMAAFQPTNELLQTPCGSPHYAAPELLNNIPYDGSLADVWSLGVVLYVMLTGDPPFNYNPDLPESRRLTTLYAQICSGRVDLPETLSTEARSLFRRIFVVNPTNRITIRDLWEHPFMHKFDSYFDFVDRPLLEDWVGPPPVLNSWKPLRRSTIDPEVLKNLLTLWHDAREDSMIIRLCNKEVNQEKFFYHALVKYRDEQLESLDYSPRRLGLIPSADDYHHIQPPFQAPASTHSRTPSQFSVVNNEHLYSKHSFFEPTPSEASYDPFRGSSDVASHKQNLSRAGSLHCRAANSYNTRAGSLRVNTLKRIGSRQESSLSRQSFSVRGASSARLSIASSRHSTRASNSLAPWHNSPRSIPGPATRHKKHVSFEHRRRGSAVSATLNVLNQVAAQIHSAATPSETVSSMPSSPPVLATYGGMMANDTTLVAPTPRTRKVKKEFENEARKVSYELEKACQDAFFTTSFSESICSLGSEDIGGHYLTEASVSRTHRLQVVNQKSTTFDRAILNRPLPPTPLGETLNSLQAKDRKTPGSYTTRDLQAMRQRLASRNPQDGATQNQQFNDILSQIDKLMPPGLPQDAKRSASAPMSGFSHPSFDEVPLQAIPEEGRLTDSEGQLSDSNHESKQRTVRIFTDPVGGLKATGATIRVVAPSSPPVQSPLTPLHVKKPRNRKCQQLEMSPVQGNFNFAAPIATNEEPKPSAPAKVAWWRRAAPKRKSEAVSTSDWEELDDRIVSKDERMLASPSERADKRLANVAPAYRVNDETSVFANSHSESEDKGNTFLSDTIVSDLMNADKKGFLGAFFKKRNKSTSKQPRSSQIHHRDLNANATQVNEDAVIKHRARLADQAQPAAPPEHWNFFRRMFNIKPESKILVLALARSKAREIICRLLQESSRHGVAEVTNEGENPNCFVGRLEKINTWELKPVSFAIEFFGILRGGADDHICVVRFTQTRGAASSLRKVVSLLEEHLSANGYILPSEKERKEIVSLIRGQGAPNNED